MENMLNDLMDFFVLYYDVLALACHGNSGTKIRDQSKS